MMPLDEVIKALEDAPLGEFSEVEINYVTVKDALHYLEAYRQLSNGTSQELRNTSQITCPKCHSVFEILDDPDGDRQQLLKCQALLQDFYRNDPLTWDELRQMEGKPVWVEYGCDFNQKRWVIIHSFHNTGSFCYMDISGNYPNTFWQKDMGEDEFWQAYRKERE